MSLNGIIAGEGKVGKVRGSFFRGKMSCHHFSYSNYYAIYAQFAEVRHSSAKKPQLAEWGSAGVLFWGEN